MDDRSALVAIISVTLIIVSIVAGVSDKTQRSEIHSHKQEAIDRGYALHCPITGEFAWIGECE